MVKSGKIEKRSQMTQPVLSRVSAPEADSGSGNGDRARRVCDLVPLSRSMYLMKNPYCFKSDDG